jgi:hypothetical protein
MIFIDVLEMFREEAGISWFNDYLHPSAEACGRLGNYRAKPLRSDRRPV